ncbi:fimbrial biogenesis chaperone [Microbulbifer rhizosphaerae]|uniref:Fimbrial chaperone protein n=1 Tax=Microbulbifer rhizosphaerae TaxID=1562603 RepID=A0A7W4WA72_9GAMM|nr:fimbria/pilus periplasmic chaperone [Microbulbifer rhizosphaerae]MBB3060525.1 fimbrial chaperone protein [Microbulbifer rhizosphaerae]
MKLIHCVFLFALALFSAPLCAKGQLQAGPILLQIVPGDSASRLRLSNTGDSPLAAQVRVFAWSQEGGEDKLVASDAVVASPPIVELPPGGKQLVRLVRLGPEARDSDDSYRLVVDELPEGITGGEAKVRVRMRYLLPLFVRAADAAEPNLSCSLQVDKLSCFNAGGRAAQLGASRLVGDSGDAIQLSGGLFGYVLPGSRRVWALPEEIGALAPGEVRLQTVLNGQPATIPLRQ